MKGLREKSIVVILVIHNEVSINTLVIIHNEVSINTLVTGVFTNLPNLMVFP